MEYDDLLLRYVAEVQDRQIFVAGAFPDIAGGGFDIDLRAGMIRFRASGRTSAVQVIGSEAQSSWMWAWANQSFASVPQLVARVGEVRRWGEQTGVQELSTPAFKLPDPGLRETLTGSSLSVVAAGLTAAPAIYACVDQARGARLYVTLEDEDLREPPHEDPLLRVVMRYPQVLALATHPAAQGGIPVIDWIEGLVGYAKGLGVDAQARGERQVELSYDGRRAVVTDDGTGLKIEYPAGAPR
jgi:hypothetical protein